MVVGLSALPQAWANDAGHVHGEILSLLAIVEHGGCAFMRNGSWYASADARKMLEYKLKQAMRDPAGVPSTEHFIEKSASRSSTSGQPYMVRCAEAKPVETGPWLMARLAEMRAAKVARPAQAPPR
jgi:hypothetical protein